jgi:DNA-binding CsgD family transcriptional regulator
VLTAPDPGERDRDADRGRTGLVERDRELGSLAGLLGAARAGDGGVLLVEGPAGIGKSALLAAACERAREAGMLALSARGGELERGFGFGVARQLFERAVASAPGSRRRALLAGAARLAAPAIGSAGASGAGQRAALDPFSVMHGLYWLTVNLSAEHAVLVSVDDAHWADLPSLRWLAYLARRLDGVRVALVVATRPADADADAAGAVLAGLRAEPAVQVVRPAALSEPAVAALASGVLRVPVAPEFARACHRLTAGNPFLLGELLRVIAAEDLPADQASVARLAQLVPDGVAAAVLVRLSRLSAEARAVARAVMLFEPHAEQRYVRELAGLDDAASALAVDALRDAEILTPGRPLAFVHPLIRQAVATLTGAAERGRAHERAAHVLDQAGADVELIASHLAETEPGGDAWVVDKLVGAGARALARGAPLAAVGHFRRALQEPPVPGQRGIVLLALGRAGFAAQQPECVEYFREAMTAGEVPSERAQAALLLGHALIWAGRATGAGEAATIARQSGAADRELALALDALELMAQSTAGEPTRFGERLERLGRELDGATKAERVLLSRIALTKAMFAHPVADVLRIIPKAVRDETPGSDEPVMLGNLRPGLVFAICDRLEHSDALLGDYLEQTRAAGLLPFYGLASATRAIPAFRRGDLTLAETSARDGLEASDSMTFAFWIPIALGMLVRVLLERGSPEQAADALDRTPAPPQLANAWTMSFVHHARGLLALYAHRPAAALAEFDRAGEILVRTGFVNPAVVEWRADAARACLLLGDRERARELAREELDLARAFGTPRAIGVALRASAAVEQPARLERLSEAAGILRGSQARLEYAHALADLGAALRRDDQRSAARQQLLEALELAHRIGAGRLESLVRDELAALGTRPRRDAVSGRDALTASEARVARMAADGMTNKQIAQALFVTYKTIDTHLYRTYQKLGITSRLELAAALAAE